MTDENQARSFGEIVSAIQVEHSYGNRVLSILPITQTNLGMTETGEKVRKKLRKKSRTLLSKITGWVVNDISEHVDVEGISDGYNVRLERVGIPLRQGSIYIGHGEYDIFHELLAEEEVRKYESEETRRQDAIIKLLFNRLGIRPDSEILEEIAARKRIGIKGLEEITREFIAELELKLPNIADEIDKKIKEEFLLLENPEYIRNVAANTIVISVGDYMREEGKKSGKKIYVPTKLVIVEGLNLKEKPFYAKDYVKEQGLRTGFAFTRAKKEKSSALLVLRDIAEEFGDKYLIVTVGSLKEAQFYQKRLQELLGRDKNIYLTPIEGPKGLQVDPYIRPIKQKNGDK